MIRYEYDTIQYDTALEPTKMYKPNGQIAYSYSIKIQLNTRYRIHSEYM